MKKTRIPNGSKVNFETSVDNIQLDSYANLTNRIKLLFATGGVFFTQSGDVLNTELSLGLANGNTGLSIAAGKALDTTGNFYELEQTTISNASTRADGFYIISLKYKELGSNPVQISNGFAYDPLGNGALSKKTRFADSYDMVYTAYTGNISALSVPVGEIYLGMVRVVSNAFVATDWSGSYPGSGVTSATGGVFDLRYLNRLTLNIDQLISDKKVLFLDRNYLGDLAVTNNIQMDGNLRVEGLLNFSDGDIEYVRFSPATRSLEVSDVSSNQAYIDFYWDAGQDTNYETVSRIRTLYVDKIKVNNGSIGTPDWMDVALIGPTPSLPRNLRIYDIYPTEDRNEKKGYVEIKWNWDELQVVNTSTTYVRISKTSYTNETVNFTALDLSTYLPGKLIYFPGSDNEYVISSVTDGSSYWEIGVVGNPVAETTETGSGAIIVDTDVEYYALRFTAAQQQGKTRKEAVYYVLDATYRYTPGFVQKLEIGRQWNCTLQALNRNAYSPTVTMAAGSYDPDHSAGGQDPVAYGSPFTMQLPEVSETGDINLQATVSGFTVRINGWTGTGQSQIHEFEIIWSSTDSLTESSFNTLAGCQQAFTSARIFHITSPAPTRYQVAVRPVQNKQGVDAPIIKQVVSGGGGVAPQEQILFDDWVSIETYRMQTIRVQPFGTSMDVSFYSDLTGSGEDIRREYLEGRYATVPQNTAIVTNWASGAGDVTYTASSVFDTDGVITPSYNAGSPPNPKTIDFTISNTLKNSVSLSGTDSGWAKVKIKNTTVGINEKISFSATAALFNWGQMDMRVKIQKVVDNTVLAETQIRKTVEYPDGIARNISVGWTNDTGTPLDVYIQIYFWANTYKAETYYTLPTNILAKLFVDWWATDMRFPNQSWSSGYQDQVSLNFGTDPIKSQAVKTSVSSSPTEYQIVHAKSSPRENRSRIRLNVLNHSIFPEGTELLIGATEKSRLLAEKSLEVDFQITTIEWWGGSAEGVSSQKPGIIRVYPKESPESAAMLEIEGVDRFGVNTGVEVKLDSNGNRGFVIDAWDPSLHPNNYGEFSGRLVVYGKPIVINNFD